MTCQVKKDIFVTVIYTSTVLYYFSKAGEKMTVSENIRRIRKEKGLTQKQLGQLCKPKISESTIRKYELGILNPKLETVRKIAEALGVYMSDLIADWGQYSPSEYAQDIETGTIDNLKNMASGAVAAGKEVMKDINEVLVLSEFRQLNDNGQKKAIEQVELLTKIPEYRKDTEESESQS